jgi:hypothetical protein
MRPSTILSLVFGVVGGGVLLLHFLHESAEHGIPEREAWLIGGFVAASLALASPDWFLSLFRLAGDTASRIVFIWRGGKDDADKSDDPADHRGT